jgi:hypothetical protein
MAYSRRLEKSKLQMVRRQLGHLIGHFHRSAVDPRATEMAETFELCMVDGDAFPLRSGEQLSRIVRRTGSWQHLIKSKGAPVAIAHSAAPGPLENLWSVQNFFVTPFADKIDRGIAKIEKRRRKRDIEVSLVAVPSKQIDFLLLRSPAKTEIYLINGHDKSRGLIEGKFYSERRFVKILSSAPFTKGFGANQPKNPSPSSREQQKTHER